MQSQTQGGVDRGKGIIVAMFADHPPSLPLFLFLPYLHESLLAPILGPLREMLEGQKSGRLRRSLPTGACTLRGRDSY